MGIAVAGFVGIFLLIVPNLLITKIIIAPLFVLLAFLVYKYLTGFALTVKVKLRACWVIINLRKIMMKRRIVQSYKKIPDRYLKEKSLIATFKETIHEYLRLSKLNFNAS